MTMRACGVCLAVRSEHVSLFTDSCMLSASRTFHSVTIKLDARKLKFWPRAMKSWKPAQALPISIRAPAQELADASLYFFIILNALETLDAVGRGPISKRSFHQTFNRPFV